mmetsp:Transcript_24488/g.67804  ORF Transcript_24488/g.67804 Transcript_24488/m.67804 type:complete len:218 (+) Transcript_24488:765-1418(+)
MFEVDVDVVQAFVEYISCEAGCHECQHEWQDILHVPSRLQKDNSKTDRHSRHSSQDSGRTHERVGARIGKCTTGMVKFVEQMTKQASKGGSREQGRHKKTRWNCNAVRQSSQHDVGDEKHEQSTRRECAHIISSCLTEMEKLLDGDIGFSEDKTGHFIVFLARLASEWNQVLDETLFLVGPILHICWQIGASPPQHGHQKGYETDQKGNSNDFKKAT